MTASNQTQQTPGLGDGMASLSACGCSSYRFNGITSETTCEAHRAARKASVHETLVSALQEIAREDAGGFYAAIANKALAKAGVTP